MEVTVSADRRTRATIPRLFEIIEPKQGALRQRCLACVLGQALGIGRYVVDDPMYPNHRGCFRIGRVRIIDNQDETFSAVRDTLPRKWRRDIFALAGVLRGNVTIRWNAGEFRVIAMAAFPHAISGAVAKRIIASLEFRYGDTCFIASIVAKPADRSISRCTARAFLERRADRIISSAKCAQRKITQGPLPRTLVRGVA